MPADIFVGCRFATVLRAGRYDRSALGRCPWGREPSVTEPVRESRAGANATGSVLWRLSEIQVGQVEKFSCPP